MISMSSLIDGPVSRLEKVAKVFAQLTPLQRIELIDSMLIRLQSVSEKWVKLSCEAKQITSSGARSEEILGGPVCCARYLRLLRSSLVDIQRFGHPKFPGSIHRDSDGRLRVPVFPAKGVFDLLLFARMRCEVWTKAGISERELHGELLNRMNSAEGEVALVLGAGNVSAIPVTDTLTKMFQENKVVLLKLNPVNDYLLPVYEELFAPLIERGYLQIVKGDAQTGSYACHHPNIKSVHITGSHHTHDAIVWGTGLERKQRKADKNPILTKPITSELGNVSPWVIIPGEYSERELHSQANNIAASLANNAGFNCLTTRVIVTSREWPQRVRFLEMLREILGKIPQRVGYYPETAKRFEKFTGQQHNHEDGTFPWLLLEDVSATEPNLMFDEESFVSACAEVPLPGLDNDFAVNAAKFCNENLFGTLCAAVTTPKAFANNVAKLTRLIDSLHYGVVCVNQWPGLVYGLMTPPWGAAPGEQIDNVASGIGNVHNLYFLDHIEKTVFHGPLTMFPKPVWLPAHKTSERLSWSLLKVYCSPKIRNLPALFANALSG